MKGQARAPLQPGVTQVIPGSGPIAGGTEITILGFGFESGATVSLAGVACTPVVFISANQIKCTTGAHTEGAKTMVIANPSGLTYEMGNAYAYFDAVKPVPGFASLSGGGVIQDATFAAVTSIGEPQLGIQLETTGMMLRPGIQGIFFDQ